MAGGDGMLLCVIELPRGVFYFTLKELHLRPITYEIYPMEINKVINKRRHWKESLYFLINVLVVIGCFFGSLFTPYRSIALLLAGGYIVLLIWIRGKTLGIIRGNAIKVTSKQFPEVYEILQQKAEVLGMSKVPTAYVVNGNGMLQAFAMRFLRRNYVVLFSDVVRVAKQDKDVLSFIIGHELAHIHLHHYSMIRSLFVLPIPILVLALSRAREYSCDAIGHYLAPKGAGRGIVLLAVGKHLFQEVNVDEWMEGARQDQGVTTWCSELFMIHPHLYNRLKAVIQWDSEGEDEVVAQEK